jgi:uncharacterized membrane protein
MIIHKQNFSLCLRFCVWIFDIMLQIFQNYFIRRKITVRRHYVRVWWKTSWWKSTDHDFLSLNDDHRWRRIIISCIDQFNDSSWFSIIRVDWIMLFYVHWHQYFLFFWTINSKFTFVKFHNMTSSSNIQCFENIYICDESLSHICLICDLISDHEQWFWLDFMKIEFLSSTSELFFRWERTIVWLFQVYNRAINQIMSELKIMIQ